MSKSRAADGRTHRKGHPIQPAIEPERSGRHTPFEPMNCLTTDWGPAIRHGCRSIAPVLVLIALTVTVAVERTYAAGFRLGCWVHAANDWLSAHWVALWVGPQPEPAPTAPLALPPAPAPIALLAPAPVPVDGFAMALQLIAAGVSIRQAACQVGMPRTTLQRRLREVATA